VLGVESIDYLPRLEAFIENRHAALMRFALKYVSSPDAYAVSVGLSDGGVLVDGRELSTEYRGWYFHGMSIQVEAVPRPGQEFQYWTRNGRRISPSSPTLRLRVTGRMRLRPVFAPAL
jgi:hypothetical protein